MEPKLLRVEEAGRVLSLGRSKTYELVRDGVLPSVRLGKVVRVPAAALEAWIAGLAAESAGASGGSVGAGSESTGDAAESPGEPAGPG